MPLGPNCPWRPWRKEMEKQNDQTSGSPLALSGARWCSISMFLGFRTVLFSPVVPGTLSHLDDPADPEKTQFQYRLQPRSTNMKAFLPTVKYSKQKMGMHVYLCLSTTFKSKCIQFHQTHSLDVQSLLGCQEGLWHQHLPAQQSHFRMTKTHKLL